MEAPMPVVVVVPGGEEGVVADGAPSNVAGGVAPVDPGRRVDGAGSPAPPVMSEEPVAVMGGMPAPGIVRPPCQTGRRVIPGAVGIGAPSLVHPGRPDLPPVRRVVIPVPVAVERSHVVGVLSVDVVCGGDARFVQRLQTVRDPEIETVARESAACRLRLFISAHHQVLPGLDGISVGARPDLGRPGASDHDRAPPRVAVDSYAGPRRQIDGRIVGVDARDLVFIGAHGNQLRLAVGQEDRGEPVFLALLVGERLERRMAPATQEQEIPICQADLDSARLRYGDFVAHRDRHVAARLDAAVQARFDGGFAGHRADVGVAASRRVLIGVFGRGGPRGQQQYHPACQSPEASFRHLRVSSDCHKERSVCHAGTLRRIEECALNKGLMNWRVVRFVSPLSQLGDTPEGDEDTSPFASHDSQLTTHNFSSA